MTSYQFANQIHVSFRAISQPQKDAINNRDGNEDMIDEKQDKTRKLIKETTRNEMKKVAVEIYDLLPPTVKKVVELAQEKGVSTWLTVLPVDEHSFARHKSVHCDTLALRLYGWRPQGMPSVCICGKE